MSDFFSRLAARAVGDAPAARPSGGLDVSAAPTATAAPPVVRATPSAPEVRSEAPEAPVEPPASGEPPVRDEPIATSEPTLPIERIETVEAPMPRELTHESKAPTPRTQEHVLRASRPARPEPAPVVVPAAPVAAAPLVRHVTETRLQRVRSVATVTAEEAPVRVHIGRLEVRANLEQPAPTPKHPAEKAKPEGLSLSEYLRGRKSA